ncbi:hypothetical protein [Vibrio tapetis]|uniref:Uncharacterized protein n=1 Tax=Vibrio tapetis subsp. tapetis TaxID=1671868 RepID=A0A2N8ZEU0_9VIBR|nr:hypothetical protein [Vibrio tapetis]SON50385.1 conserved protein of unknown function [Vibrio tapetis subsp. tapetis]
MFSKKRSANRLKQQSVSSNRRKRMLSNNKKKVIWRCRGFAMTLEE